MNDYEPKVGDIVIVKGKVIALNSETSLVRVDTPDGPIWVEAGELTLVERPKRELKPGDRLIHNESTEYIVLDNDKVWSPIANEVIDRSNLTFDANKSESIWQYFPRNETAE